MHYKRFAQFLAIVMAGTSFSNVEAHTNVVMTEPELVTEVGEGTETETKTETEREVQSNITEEQILDESGNQIIGPGGYALVKRETNSQGQVIRESYFDLEIDFHGTKKYVEFKNSTMVFNSAAMGRMSYEISNADKPFVLVFLLRDNIDAREAVQKFAGRFKKNSNNSIECCLFEDFLEEAFGFEVKDLFQKAMIGFKEEMHQAIGYQITELCSPYNLQKLKGVLEEELTVFDYDSIKRERFTEAREENPLVRDLNDRNYNIIKDTYIRTGRYRLLVGNSDFAESFLTSEWLLKKYFALEALDNTFIVSGYLKSIEQLLWDIIAIIGQGRSIRGVSISAENEEEIDKTLGALQYFMTSYSNDDLFQSVFGGSTHFVMNYLKNQISNWRTRYRNGYFHKHNLNEIDKINSIKEETYFLYLLILGSIKLNSDEMRQLDS